MFTDEKGYSWPEALLTLAIVMLIFGTLLPHSILLRDRLEMKKISMYAAETLYVASLLNQSYGYQQGERSRGGISFEWQWREHELCVYYSVQQQRNVKCVSR